MTEQETAFLAGAYAAAQEAKHVWPAYAACEAALESDFGRSELAQKANNLFNFRAPSKRNSTTQVIALSTKTATSDWLRFSTTVDCFRYRQMRIDSLNMFHLVRRATSAEQYLFSMFCTAALRVMTIYEDGKAVLG